MSLMKLPYIEVVKYFPDTKEFHSLVQQHASLVNDTLIIHTLTDSMTTMKKSLTIRELRNREKTKEFQSRCHISCGE